MVIDYHGDVRLANALVEEIELGARAISVAANFADPKQVELVTAAAVHAYGGIDIFVNNPGIERRQPFLKTPFQLLRNIIGIDLGGVGLCTQAAGKEMVGQERGGRIVNVSLIHEELAIPINAPYFAAKAGCVC